MTSKKITESGKRTHSACCDIFNGDDKVVLRLEMPGVSKENLDIRVDNDILAITGKKQDFSGEGKYIIREIRSEDYFQKFTLDDTIDRENIDASVKNGVVTLTLGLKESVKPRKIEIR